MAAPAALKPVTKKVADAAKTEESEAVQTSESTTAENKKSLWSGNSEDDDDDEEWDYCSSKQNNKVVRWHQSSQTQFKNNIII